MKAARLIENATTPAPIDAAVPRSTPRTAMPAVAPATTESSTAMSPGAATKAWNGRDVVRGFERGAEASTPVTSSYWLLTKYRSGPGGHAEEASPERVG